MTSNSGRLYGKGTLVLVVLASSIAAGASAYLLGRASQQPDPTRAATPSEASKPRYQCPMHPSVVMDHPGECPICGMRLVKVADSAAQADATTQGAPRVLAHADDPREGAAPVAGQATVDIDPARQQLIGLTTAEVTAGPVGGAWRTVGRVAVDETRVRHINVKVPSFVEHVYVDFVGKRVGRGDPLFSVYSPELLSAQEEYLLALRTRDALAKRQALGRDGDDLVSAARRKLALWDVPESEVARIEQTGETTKTLTFRSPISGAVTKKDVVEGMKLDSGAMPYEIVDLSTLWVLADVYETELSLVKEGMPASLTLKAFPNREFKGKVLFIDPLLDPQTRTVKVRLAFANPSGELRPEMFGEVTLHGTPRQGLRIPKDAVIDSGTDKIVFVALGEGKFEPRKVLLGEASGNEVEVVSGLEAGDRVVTRANFLIDSESKLRASLAEMAAGAASQAPKPASAAPPGHEGHAP